MPSPNLRTLVLNQGYEPVRVVNWQRAITMVYLDKARILNSYPDQVYSARQAHDVPAVIWLRRNVMWIGRKAKRPPPDVKFTRFYVYARDGWKCQYCGERFPASDLTFDHVTPRAQGGRTLWTNIVTACGPCNQAKGDRTPEQAGMPLLRKPREPRWLPALLVKSLSDKSIPEQWHDYIGWLSAA
jgi:5-methylcytosine-specific restriction endonuclease McrA